MHLEKVTGKVIPLPSSGPSVPVRKYRIEPVFTPAPQQAAFRAVSQGNRSHQSSSGTAFRPTFEKLGVPASAVKNKGEAHMMISRFQTGEEGLDLQRRFRTK